MRDNYSHLKYTVYARKNFLKWYDFYVNYQFKKKKTFHNWLSVEVSVASALNLDALRPDY